MHKFFCNYNNLTEKYELSRLRGAMFSPRISVQAESSLLPEIQQLLQALYETILSLKNLISEEESLNGLDEVELLTANLYYSLFASPLELASEVSSEKLDAKSLTSTAIEKASKLEELINIPEYNRLIGSIKDKLQNLFNRLATMK